MTQVYIVRHGNTFEDGEIPRRIGVRSDLPLVTSGRAQADQLGRYFDQRGIQFDRALCGSLLRTSETAAGILAYQRTPTIRRAAWLDELDHGVDEGRPETEVISRVGREALDAWDWDATIPDGWTADTRSRVAAWRRFLNSTVDGRSLLVTSNGAARFVFLAMVLPRPRTGLKLRTGSYGVLDRGKDGVWCVTEWDVRPAS